MKSKYQMGWIGLRVNKVGRSTRNLKKAGWMRLHHSELNNRNGFDWVLPLKTHDQFKAFKWSDFASNGLDALTFWITDAQWGVNSGLTDSQWIERKVISA